MRLPLFSPRLVLAGALLVPAAAAGCDVEHSHAPVEAGSHSAPAASAGVAPTFGSELLAELRTSEGVMLAELYPSLAPQTVAAFERRAAAGVYDGLDFFRVVPGYLVQTGDPTGSGFGSDDADPLPLEPNDLSHLRGTLSMARLGHPDTAGSQFFICAGDATHLDGKYTAFGRLISGYDILDAIANAPADGEHPLEPVPLQSVVVRSRTDDDPSPGH